MVVIGLLALAAAIPVISVANQLTAPAQATGIVVAVNETGPLKVSSFTLRTSSGELITFQVGDLQVGGRYFDGPHLKTHQATALPIVVTYRVENGQKVAFRLADAPTQ